MAITIILILSKSCNHWQSSHDNGLCMYVDYKLNSKSRLKLLGAHHSSFSLNRLNNWTHLNTLMWLQKNTSNPFTEIIIYPPLFRPPCQGQTYKETLWRWRASTTPEWPRKQMTQSRPDNRDAHSNYSITLILGSLPLERTVEMAHQILISFVIKSLISSSFLAKLSLREPGCMQR